MFKTLFSVKMTLLITDRESIAKLTAFQNSIFQRPGLIDPAKEQEKLEKKRGVLSSSLEKLKKSMEMDGYETKVPAEVRAANAEKLQQIETELTRLADAVDTLKNM